MGFGVSKIRIISGDPVGWETRHRRSIACAARRSGALPTRPELVGAIAWAKLRGAVQIMLAVPGNFAHPTAHLQARTARIGSVDRKGSAKRPEWTSGLRFR
jgi:hypothetical protein